MVKVAGTLEGIASRRRAALGESYERLERELAGSGHHGAAEAVRQFAQVPVPRAFLRERERRPGPGG